MFCFCLNSFADDFSFFAVLDLSMVRFFDDVIRKLGSGIPNKTKLVCGHSKVTKLSETLQLSFDDIYNPRLFSVLLAGILNKRWQMLDLRSMIEEYRRAVRASLWWRFYGQFSSEPLIIRDTLSTLPRFKRNEDLS